MMNILYTVHQFFPNHYTGTERLVLNLSKQMQRNGHNIKVLTYGITESDGFQEKLGFYIKEYTYQGVPVISVRHKSIPELVSFSVFDEPMKNLFDEILSEEDIDIIHVCHAMRIGSVIWSAKERGIPVILTLTDFWLMCPRGIAITTEGSLCDGSDDGEKCLQHCYQGKFWRTKLPDRAHHVKMVLDYAGRVVSATYFLKRFFEKKGLCQNIKIIRFGIDFRNVRINTKMYDENSVVTIGYLSYLNPHKGAHLLLEAYQKVKPSNVDIRIYGDAEVNTEYLDNLKKIAHENPHITFLGKYDFDEMPDMLDTLDIVAVPSIWWENSPLVLLRSLAHNVPAIVSELGGLTEVIRDGENGFAFKIRDDHTQSSSVENLAEIIRKISDNPTVLNLLKNNIHPPARIEEEAFNYECEYFSLLNENKEK